MSNRQAVVKLHACNFPDVVPYRNLVFTSDSDRYDVGRTSKREAKNLMSAQKNALYDSRVMSRNHAQLWVSLDTRTLYINDQGSMHGTFVNDKRIPYCEDVVVQNGDEITFGTQVVRVGDTFDPLTVRCECNWVNSIQDNTPSNLPSNTFVVPDDDDDIEITSGPVPTVIRDSSESGGSVNESDSDIRSLDEAPSPVTSPLKQSSIIIEDEDDCAPEELSSRKPEDDGNFGNREPSVPRANPTVTVHTLLEQPSPKVDASQQPNVCDDCDDNQMNHPPFSPLSLHSEYSDEDSDFSSVCFGVNGDESGSGSDSESEDDSFSEKSGDSDAESSGQHSDTAKSRASLFLENLRVLRPAVPPNYSSTVCNMGAPPRLETQSSAPLQSASAPPKWPEQHSDFVGGPSLQGPPAAGFVNFPARAPTYSPPSYPPQPQYWTESSAWPSQDRFRGVSGPDYMCKLPSMAYALGRNYRGESPYTNSNLLVPNANSQPDNLANTKLWDGPLGSANALASPKSRIPVPPPYGAVHSPYHIPRNIETAARDGNNTSNTRVSISDILEKAVPEPPRAPPKRKLGEMEESVVEGPFANAHPATESLLEDTDEEMFMQDAQPPELEVNGQADDDLMPDLTSQKPSQELNPTVESEPIQPVVSDPIASEDERPAKRAKTSHRRSLGSHAASAAVGAVVGAVGTIAVLASLPAEYFL